jgi:hypothetical protein
MSHVQYSRMAVRRNAEEGRRMGWTDTHESGRLKNTGRNCVEEYSMRRNLTSDRPN